MHNIIKGNMLSYIWNIPFSDLLGCTQGGCGCVCRGGGGEWRVGRSTHIMKLINNLEIPVKMLLTLFRNLNMMYRFLPFFLHI